MVNQCFTDQKIGNQYSKFGFLYTNPVNSEYLYLLLTIDRQD